MTRGNTILAQGAGLNYLLPQWSPPLKDGSTGDEAGELILQLRAAMEPAVERWEYLFFCLNRLVTSQPQWSGTCQTE